MSLSWNLKYKLFNIIRREGCLENCPGSGSGFGLGLALELGLGAVFPRGQFSQNRSKEGLVFKLYQLIEKIYRKCASRTNFRHLFKFGKQLEIETLDSKNFDKTLNLSKIQDYQKSSKYLNSFLFPTPVSSHGHHYEKQKGPGTSNHSPTRLQNMFGSFLSSEVTITWSVLML